MRRLLALISVLLVASSLTAGAANALEVVPGRSILIAADDPAGLTARGHAPARLLPDGVRGELAGRYLVVDGGTDAVALAAELRALPGVAAAMVAGTRELFWEPNDPYLSTQWHFQEGHPAGIRVAEAWDLQTGSADAVIAVIDTGVDWSHPDLAPTTWQNPGEIPGNLVDDDGNGFVDDVRGWDCGDDDADARPETYLEGGIDVGFHGTHCAGIVAAATDNGLGVAGTAPGCRIMPLKAVSTASGFTDAAIVMAFAYAIDNGADVVSMSFGGPGDGGAAGFYQDLVDQAIAAGVVPVAAAGNNDDAALMYPAACDGVISVGATDPDGNRASYSTYGSWVAVNAPGSQIWSTVQQNYSWDYLTGILFQLLYGWDGTNPYMYSDGTSMACPMVAGVVGLIRSSAPALAPTEITQLLLDTGDDVTYDQPLGVKVNAEAALLALDVTATPPAAGPQTLAAAPNPFNPRTTLRLELSRARDARLEIVDLRGRLVRTLIRGERLAAGVHARGWDGRGDDGRALPSGLYLARAVLDGRVTTAKLTLTR
jgi:subtilisin family serine protease